MNYPRLVMAAPRSGSGKTLITIGIMRLLQKRGMKVSGFKCGPDYIDPMFHKKILGIPSKNLDLFFTDEEKTRELFARHNEGDISIIEGVMGLYDGLAGISSEASTYHLAKTIKAPIILVIDSHGMGISVMAEIAGFLSMDTEGLIKGIILNRMNKSYFETIKGELQKKIDIPILGCFPMEKDIHLESRHLGLVMPDELSEIDKMIELAATRLEENVDVDRLISIAGEALEIETAKEEFYCNNNEKIRIAIARDEAFCFIYEDNLNLIKKLGGEPVFFSPLKDKALPDNIQGLILYGGYPELYAKELSENCEMLKAIKSAIDKGIPYLAECGGFMYLHDSIITKEGDCFSMVGAISGKASYSGKLVRFGYASFMEKEATFMSPNNEIRGHEFHYYDSTNNGDNVIAKKPVNGRSWECVHEAINSFAGFPHLYYESNPEFIKGFLDQCRFNS